MLQAPTARDALLEVEALLDHLFQHPNTPGFVAYRMIQRFVTSNPSSSYVQAVSDAFKTGREGGGQVFICYLWDDTVFRPS